MEKTAIGNEKRLKSGVKPFVKSLLGYFFALAFAFDVFPD